MGGVGWEGKCTLQDWTECLPCLAQALPAVVTPEPPTPSPRRSTSRTRCHVHQHALLDLPHRLVQLLQAVGDVQVLQQYSTAGQQSSTVGVSVSKESSTAHGGCQGRLGPSQKKTPPPPTPISTPTASHPTPCSHLHAAVGGHQLVLHVGIPQAQPDQVVHQMLVQDHKLACVIGMDGLGRVGWV